MTPRTHARTRGARTDTAGCWKLKAPGTSLSMMVTLVTAGSPTTVPALGCFSLRAA
ncbi:MAG: hypothetical protein ACK4ZJ_17650 [Allorhizobium sp.]